MPADPVDAKQIAAQLISKAWQDAVDRGVTTELVASTALSAALASLVKQRGRDATLRIVNRLVEAVRAGKFD